MYNEYLVVKYLFSAKLNAYLFQGDCRKKYVIGNGVSMEDGVSMEKVLFIWNLLFIEYM